MSYETLIYKEKSLVAWIQLNRPKEMNSISKKLIEELLHVVEKVEKDESIRAIVLFGKGKAFCAGADLKELLTELENETSGEKVLLDYIEDLFFKLNHLSKPLIVGLNGITLAGGLEIAMTADIVVAAEEAKIGDGHANFGVLPGAGGAVRLPTEIGINRANYLLMTGDMLDASVWKKYGFVNEVVPAKELEETIEKIVAKIVLKSPLVLKQIKKLIRDGLDQPLEQSLYQELLTLKSHMQSYDFKEGLRAFAEKRKPDFKGY